MKSRNENLRRIFRNTLICFAALLILGMLSAVTVAAKAPETGSGVIVPLSGGEYEDKDASSARLFYNQLPSYSKKIYRFLNKKNLKKKKLKRGASYSFWTTMSLIRGGNINKVSKFVKFDKKVQKGVYAFRMDHMEKCYFLRDFSWQYLYRYTTYDGVNAKVTIYKIVFTPIRSYSNVLKDDAKVKKALSVMKSYIVSHRASSSRYHTLYTMCKYMTLRFTHNGSGYAPSYTPASVLLSKFGNQGVCEAYAKVCFIMCKKFGIPVIYAESDNHAYTFVKMENGKWYGLDTDWIDDNHPVKKGKMDMKWFLYGSNQLASIDQGNTHQTKYTRGSISLKAFSISPTPYKRAA